MRKIIYPLAFTALIIIISVFACQKEAGQGDNGGQTRLKVFLTDDPANYDEVVIDIQDVQVNITNGSSSGWQSLSNVATGLYNVLDLVNGNDTLIADSQVPDGATITQVRLVLGSNNYVVENGNIIELETPSAQQSGLKVNVHQQLDSGFLYNLVLDFDAARSIVRTGNGKLILKPVVRANFQLTAGRIRGVVTPDTVLTTVYAIQGTDSAGTFTDSQGNYLISGLAAGTYSLHFIPGDTTFFFEQRNGINVALGTITVVDTVHLHQ
jgi:hypothetical protein